MSKLTRYRCTPPGVHPPLTDPAYRSTSIRNPLQPLVVIPQTLSEVTGPALGYSAVGPLDCDLTRQHAGEPLGERIIVQGRVLDEADRPVPGALVEIWQCNAAGRYRHERDAHDAPLDLNFSGAGRALTDAHGGYRFVTIKPGAYPWGNHSNAWRPAHIHFSVFGNDFLARLVTQMYFPGDPLLALDPILNSIPDESARQRLVSSYAHDVTQPEWALGYRFDIVLCGGRETPFETKEV